MSAEFIGTFIIVFLGCGSIRAAAHIPPLVNADFIPITFGVAVMIAIYALGHISGAHFNPAVTLAFAVGRHFPVKDIPAYWLAQISGATLASWLVSILIVSSPSFGETIPRVSTETALLWEIVLTFILMFVIISVATNTKAVGTMAGIAIGAAVLVCAYVGGPFTGASMNPARSFGPAVMLGDLSHMWIYSVGPAIGATLAALTYGGLRGEDKPSL